MRCSFVRVLMCHVCDLCYEILYVLMGCDVKVMPYRIMLCVCLWREKKGGGGAGR